MRWQPAVKKRVTATLAPYDMAKLVAGYDDYYSSRGEFPSICPFLELNHYSDDSPNLVVILDRMEVYDAEVLQDVIYACRYVLFAPITTRY